MGIPLDYTPPASRARPSAGSGAHLAADATSKSPADPTAAGRSAIRRSPRPRASLGRLLANRQPNNSRHRYLTIDPVSLVDGPPEDSSLPPLNADMMSPWNNILSDAEIIDLFDIAPSDSEWARQRIRRPRLSLDAGRSSSTTNTTRPSFSPRFAPAHPDDDLSVPELEDSSSSVEGIMDSSMPLLRRVGHRSVATARNRPQTASRARPALPLEFDRIWTPLDGPHPFMQPDRHADADTWSRLLNSIPPDERLPSANSSFTSATALASASASASAPMPGSTSAATSTSAASFPATLTPTSSFGSTSSRMHVMFDPFPSLAANCDFVSSSETSDTEADEDLQQYLRSRSQVRLHPQAPPSTQAPTQPPTPPTTQPTTQATTQPDTQTATPTQSQSQSQEQTVVPSPSDIDTPTASSFTLENEAAGLQMLHDTLNLLSRRNDIPDEWWATAGLTRIVDRELNRSSSHSNTDANAAPSDDI